MNHISRIFSGFRNARRLAFLSFSIIGILNCADLQLASHEVPIINRSASQLLLFKNSKRIAVVFRQVTDAKFPIVP